MSDDGALHLGETTPDMRYQVYFAIDTALLSGSPENLALARDAYGAFVTRMTANPLADMRMRARVLEYGDRNGVLSDLLPVSLLPSWDHLVAGASSEPATSFLSLLKGQAAQDYSTLLGTGPSTGSVTSPRHRVLPWSAFLLSASGVSPLDDTHVEELSRRSAVPRLWRIHLLSLGQETAATPTRTQYWPLTPGRLEGIFDRIVVGDGLWDSDAIYTGPIPVVVSEGVEPSPRTNRSSDMTVSRSALEDLHLIGRGGSCSVWSVNASVPGLEYREGVVFRALRDSPDRTALVSATGTLIERFATLPQRQRRFLEEHLIVPLRLVAAGDDLVGILARRFPDDCFLDLRPRGDACAERRLFLVQDLMTPESLKPKRGIPAATAKERLYVFLDALRVVELLHSLGVVLGDINSHDIALRSPAPGADASTRRRFQPLFLRAHGFRVQGTIVPITQMHTPNWIPPEVRAAAVVRDELTAKHASPVEISRARAAANIQTTKSDIFKMGLLALRLLHIPGDPDEDDTQSVYISATAAANIERLVNPQRARLLHSMLDTDPSSRPSAHDVLAAFSGR